MSVVRCGSKIVVIDKLIESLYIYYNGWHSGPPPPSFSYINNIIKKTKAILYI